MLRIWNLDGVDNFLEKYKGSKLTWGGGVKMAVWEDMEFTSPHN